MIAFLAIWPHPIDVTAALELGLPIEELATDRFGYTDAARGITRVPEAVMQVIAVNSRQWHARNRSKSRAESKARRDEYLSPSMTEALTAISRGAIQPTVIAQAAANAGLRPADVTAAVGKACAAIEKHLASPKGRLLLSLVFDPPDGP